MRGRLGFLATPSLLIYGTAGLAYGETKASGTISIASPNSSIGISAGAFGLACQTGATPPSACYAGSGTRTSVGWAAGAGLEHKITANWSAKLEYLHVELPGQTVTLLSPPPSTPGVFINYRYNRESVDIVRVGVNYTFDWAPVVAKY